MRIARTIIALALLLWGGGVACAKPAPFHRAVDAPSPGDVTIASATINSNGDELTVALSDSATISNATGWTVEFDNGASRTLSYASGSGTSSLVFDLEAVSPSTDGRAPIGTVCTFDYDADAGNIAGLSDATAVAVTNNSTAIPDPDLPQSMPTGELPPNWNGTADYTPANNAALAALLDGNGSGDAVNGTAEDWTIIELTAGGDYTGGFAIDDSCRYIEIRSSGYASLPAFSLDDKSGQVDAGDEANMATISRTPAANNQAVLNISGGASPGTGASHIRFIGIKFAMYGSYGTDVLAMASTLTGGLGTDVDKLCDHIGFDRCAFTHDGTMKGVQDCIRLDADDFFVVGCNFEGLKGAGNDGSNAGRTYQGHRGLVRNNRFNCNGAAWFLGDNFLTTVEDFEFSRNYHFRNSNWGTSHGNNKGSFEAKTGLRVLVEENVFNYQFDASGFGAITVKAEGTGGPKTTRHVSVIGNRASNCAQAFVIHVGGSSDDADVGPNHDMLFKHNLGYDFSTRAVQLIVYDANSALPFERLQLVNNTLKGSFFVQGSDAGATPGRYCRMIDNVFVGTNGYLLNAGASGALGFNYSWGSNYSVTYNLWANMSASNYDNDTTPSPLGTLSNNAFPANTAAVGFVDEPNDDYEISESSAYKNSSSTGGKPGYDSTTYDAIWSEVAQ